MPAAKYYAPCDVRMRRKNVVVANCPDSRLGEARTPDFTALASPLQILVTGNAIAQEASMNRDVFAGWWKQARGQAKSWWGQLTDDDLDQIEGEAEKLVGALQTRYGWSREEAEREVDRRMGRAA